MKKIYVAVLAFFFLLAAGCGRIIGGNKTPVDKTPVLTPNEQSQPVVEEPVVKNPLTGLNMDKDKEGRRPLAVMIENEKSARPQSGLNKADVVYEVLAEGGITRFLAIYLGEDAGEIGPVRSARPYFIDFAMEYDPVYVHYGASQSAYSDLQKNKNIYGIDGIYDRVTFWRDKTRKAPHNAYTSTENILETARRRGYLKPVYLKRWEFNEGEAPVAGEPLEEFELVYYKNYTVKYVYDEEKKAYVRYINEKPHTDRKTGDPIVVKNIILQFMDTRVIDSEGRLAIKTTGSGTGYYISNGSYTRIKWHKPGRFKKTEYTLEGGGQLKLNPGNTWIQILPSRDKFKIGT
ncbi:DUF3048 domain-containing protein [Thermosediminibacter oceani]|uniref:Lipoprotein YerB n=1 Tax=Thermosediminibacter oceani (strain ATCC BAA-1034 / DSM 16646 / JW/IW-1228P) TaxID=555079 RepID=D9S2Q8_THEOJ|nr:DUF3048 domain-containing protein [Thermosediminibacter oceani]ADL07685.1 conserved hypothetical protein [Thermosediminibacter oceani DSM 16646]